MPGCSEPPPPHPEPVGPGRDSNLRLVTNLTTIPPKKNCSCGNYSTATRSQSRKVEGTVVRQRSPGRCPGGTGALPLHPDIGSGVRQRKGPAAGCHVVVGQQPVGGEGEWNLLELSGAGSSWRKLDIILNEKLVILKKVQIHAFMQVSKKKIHKN